MNINCLNVSLLSETQNTDKDTDPTDSVTTVEPLRRHDKTKECVNTAQHFLSKCDKYKNIRMYDYYLIIHMM